MKLYWSNTESAAFARHARVASANLVAAIRARRYARGLEDHSSNGNRDGALPDGQERRQGLLVSGALGLKESAPHAERANQRLSNLGIDPDLPDEEIKRRLAALSEKHAEEEAEALMALNLTLPPSRPS